MAISKEAAHARAVKAAATRARNKARGYPAGYKAPVTQKLPQTVAYEHPRAPTRLEKGVRRVPVTTSGRGKSLKKMSLSELQGEFTKLRNTPHAEFQARQAKMTDKQRSALDRRYYALKDEIRDRYSLKETGETSLQRGKRYGEEYRAKVKAQKAKARASAKKKNPAAHRKDLWGAHRRLMNAYDMARTPVAKRKILARVKRIEAEMNKRDMYS